MVVKAKATGLTSATNRVFRPKVDDLKKYLGLRSVTAKVVRPEVGDRKSIQA
jgi:hypothetical protein